MPRCHVSRSHTCPSRTVHTPGSSLRLTPRLVPFQPNGRRPYSLPLRQFAQLPSCKLVFLRFNNNRLRIIRIEIITPQQFQLPRG